MASAMVRGLPLKPAGARQRGRTGPTSAVSLPLPASLTVAGGGTEEASQAARPSTRRKVMRKGESVVGEGGNISGPPRLTRWRRGCSGGDKKNGLRWPLLDPVAEISRHRGARR